MHLDARRGVRAGLHEAKFPGMRDLACGELDGLNGINDHRLVGGHDAVFDERAECARTSVKLLALVQASQQLCLISIVLDWCVVNVQWSMRGRGLLRLCFLVCCKRAGEHICELGDGRLSGPLPREKGCCGQHFVRSRVL